MKLVKDIANRVLRYIGMEVHKDSTTAVVWDAQGSLVMPVTLRSADKARVDFLRGLRGALPWTLEEGTYSAWLDDRLSPPVEERIGCNPRQNALRKQGHQSDRSDARKRAEWLRRGSLTAVYHRAPGRRALQELAASDAALVSDGTRGMSRLKALYRGRGIGCGGTPVYSPRHRSRGLEPLTEAGAGQRAKWLYPELDRLRKLRPPARRALRSESRKRPAPKILRTIPGRGAIRVALLRTPGPLPPPGKAVGYQPLIEPSRALWTPGWLVTSPLAADVRSTES
jgi:hypothetical protein